VGVPLFRTELTTVLTTTMTTVRLPDTLNHATVELASRLVTRSARAYGSEGYGSNQDQIPLSDSLLFGFSGWRPTTSFERRQWTPAAASPGS
jgi:hypothetical protein